MKRGNFYLCSILFLTLTAMKMIAPAAAADVRAVLIPAISEDTDYRAAVRALHPQTPAPGPDTLPYAPVPPMDRLDAAVAALTPDHFAALPKHPIPAPPPEPEISPEQQAALDAKAAFLEAQAAYADKQLPANVSYDIPELPFAHAAPLEGYTSSGFGFRMHPLKQVVSFHYGTDFAANAGTEIRAFAAGTVIAAAESPGYGYYVKLSHGNGFATLYAHCSRLLVSAGETVELGTPIALVGATGKATGPHLHFELIRNGVYLNPEFYLAV